MGKDGLKKRLKNKRSHSIRLNAWKARKGYTSKSSKPFIFENPNEFYHKPIAITVQAPVNFSFINNTDAILKFLQEMKRHIDNGDNISIDLHKVEHLTSDTVAILLSHITNKDFAKNAKFSGNLPVHQESRKLLEDSGYLNILISGYPTRKSDGAMISFRKNKRVDPKIAQKARMLTSKYTFSNPQKKIQPLTATLIECMGNTRNHASRKGHAKEMWWLTVYHNPITKITSFTFVDTGVGICESVKTSALKDSVYNNIRLMFTTNKEIFEKLLVRQLGSSTGLPFRGRGLPKIHQYCVEGHLKNLRIISNDVYSDIQNGIYSEMNEYFSGTSLYWEIWPN